MAEISGTNVTADKRSEAAKKKKNGIFLTFFKNNMYTILSVVFLVILWEVLVRVLNTPEYLVPAPSVIVKAVAAHWQVLAKHGWVTLYEVLLGFGIAMGIGFPLAILIVYVPLFEKTAYALLVSAQAIPKVALAPILVSWWGFSIFPKLFVAFLVCFFPIIVNTVIGLKSISREMLYLARSLGASGMQQFWKFRVPQALPNIFGGLKVGITLSVVGAVVGEYVAANKGLGYYQVVAGGNLDTPMVFAILILLSLMGIVLFNIVNMIERVAIKGDPSRKE